MNGGKKISKKFIVLALYEVHMASAALMVDGEVIAAAHEERFSRLKNDMGFPLQSALFCLRTVGINPGDIDTVVMVNESFNHDGIANILFKRSALYSLEDWIHENDHYWKPKLLEKRQLGSYFKAMGGWDRIPAHHYCGLSSLNMTDPPGKIASAFNQVRKQTVEKLLSIPEDRVVFAPHYLCHHYHAYYSGNTRGDDVVIMHMEGDGGRYNSAVSYQTPKGIEVIGGSNESDLGRLYQWITLLLGMKPYHHEYKVMGLAAYATEGEVEKSYKILEPIFRIDDEKKAVVYNQRPTDLYFYFQEQFRGHRFDGIAGALQRLLEKFVVKWAKSVIETTGRHSLCYGGGVAMNVKANMLLAQQDAVRSLYVPLSPADESNVIGAGYWATEQYLLRNDKNPETIPALKSPYLGPDFNCEEVSLALESLEGKNGFQIKEKTEGEEVAKLLARGWTVAVCQGNSEFGQRALGNRSILAHPSLPGIVNKINKQIKYRDFWMPFCPTILDEDQHRYLENPKNLRADYMTLGFPVNPSRLETLQGVIHPGDGTARPQILRREQNHGYYDLIKSFKSLTGTGALLNTSFNLHGEPMVSSPRDALDTFFRSNLDAVWIGDVLVSRRQIEHS